MQGVGLQCCSVAVLQGAGLQCCRVLGCEVAGLQGRWVQSCWIAGLLGRWVAGSLGAGLRGLVLRVQRCSLKRKQARSVFAADLRTFYGAPNGNRTRVSALKGPRPDL